MEINWNLIEKTSTCWIWKNKLSKGYGHIEIKGKNKLAHRYVYEILIGKIPKKLQIDHLCRNRACVNPAHLEAVTAQTNVLRGMGLGGILARRTHCKHGHFFCKENLLKYHAGRGRRCKTCSRKRTRIYYYKIRENKV